METRLRFREFVRASRKLCARNRDELAERNRIALGKLCMVYGLLLSAYTILAISSVEKDSIRILCGIFLILHLVFCCALLFPSKRRRQPAWITRLCICFNVMVMACVITISLVAFPNSPALYFPMVLVASSVVFIFPYGTTLLLSFLYTALFALGVWLASEPFLFFRNLIAALAGFAVSAACSYVIAYMQLRENAVRSHLEYLSAIDELTGLSNKSTTEYLCQSYLDHHYEELCALFVIDLDNFKDINDTFGHARGDELLRAAGNRLRSLFRESDITGRIGGDEFLVLMKNISHESVAERKAQQIVAELGSALHGGAAFSASCSVGCIVSAGGYTSYQSLFIRADQALYQAKSSGKGRYAFYCETSTQQSEHLCLIVGDSDKISRSVLQKGFRSTYTVVNAWNGFQVLDLLNRFDKQVAAILVDLEFVNLDGDNLIRRIQDNPQFAQVPIFVLASRRRARKMTEKSVEVISRPFDIKVVAAQVNEAVRRFRA